MYSVRWDSTACSEYSKTAVAPTIFDAVIQQYSVHAVEQPNRMPKPEASIEGEPESRRESRIDGSLYQPPSLSSIMGPPTISFLSFWDSSDLYNSTAMIERGLLCTWDQAARMVLRRE